jgi:hypothetical protein
MQPGNSSRHLRALADEKIVNGVAVPACVAEFAALERLVVQDGENRGQFVTAQTATLPGRGVPQVLLEMRHYDLGSDLIGARLDRLVRCPYG